MGFGAHSGMSSQTKRYIENGGLLQSMKYDKHENETD